MSTITLHTGCAGDTTTLNVEWYDHNNVRHRTEIAIAILAQDKPRTLVVTVNGDSVHVDAAGEGSELRYLRRHAVEPR